MLETKILELDKTLEPIKTEEMAGYLITHTIVDIKALTALLDLSDHNRISQILEGLLEQGAIRGEVKGKNKIQLVSVPEPSPNPELSAVPPESLPLLGALISFEEFSVSTFAELFRLRKKAVKQEICRLAANGHISGIFLEKDKFHLEQAPSPDPIPIFRLTPLTRLIVGACLVYKNLQLSALVNITGEQDEKELLKDLLILFARQNLKGYLTTKGKNVQIHFEDIGYEQTPLPLSKLMGRYRIVSGALIAYPKTSLREIANKTQLSELELRRTIYTLAADGTLDPVISKGKIWLKTLPTITRTMTVDQLSEQKLLVLGIALGQKKCSLRSIARWLNTEIFTVRKIFFQMILCGLLQGTIDLGVKEEFQMSDSFSSDLPPVPLETDDFIILGALIANPKAEIRSLASQLGLSATDFERTLYLMLAKRAMEGEVQGRYFLFNKALAEQPSPPNSELDSPEAVTALGYLLARTEVSFRDMAKDLEWDQIQTVRTAYYLVGIGTIRGQMNGDKFRLQAALRRDSAQAPINLGAPYEKMLTLFQTQSEEMYSIKDLAKTLNTSQPMVREQLSRLIGEGILQGVLESKKFTRVATGPTLIKKKEHTQICAHCGIRITDSVCPQCGLNSSQCVVCSKLLDTNDSDLVSCPTCKAVAHRTHLKEWVKTRGTCPNCKTRLSMEMLDSVVVSNSV